MKMSTFKRASPSISVSKPSNESDVETEKMTSNLFFCLSINARSILYRRMYLLQMICFPFIPILALFIQNLLIFMQQIDTYDETRDIHQQVSSLNFIVCNKSQDLFNQIGQIYGWCGIFFKSLTLLLMQYLVLNVLLESVFISS